MIPLRLAAALAAAVPATAQQQELFLLDDVAQVWRVDGYRTTNASVVPIVQVPVPAGRTAVDLAVDPATGDFFVLLTSFATTEIARVDAATGALTVLCTVGSELGDGLDRNADGTLVTVLGMDELALVDPATCGGFDVPTTLLGFHTSTSKVAYRERGDLRTGAPDGSAWVVDPFDGAATPVASGPLFSVHALELDFGGDLLVGSFDGSVFRVDGATSQLFQPLGPQAPSGRVFGLALTLPIDGLGVAHECDGRPNSTGGPSTLEVVGLASAAANDLELRARDLPPDSLGYFLMGPNGGSTPLGQGVLCVGTPQFRYSLFVQDAGPAGAVRFPLDTTSLASGGAAVPGDSFVFQYWHRDVPATSNLGPAKRVTFR